MATRLLRDWTDSDRFDGISAEAERLFVRLLMKADDYGRFHAEPRRLKAALFPLIENLRQDALIRWLDELSTRQLVLLYESSDHRQLLAIPKFGQRLKQSVPKFPPPPGMPDNWLPDVGEVLPRSGVPLGTSRNEPEVPGSSGKTPEPGTDPPEVPAVFGDVFGDGDGRPARKRASTSPPSRPEDVSEQVWADWLALRSRKKAPVTVTVLAEARKEAGKAGLPLERFLSVWCARGSQGLQAEWLKPGERGADEGFPMEGVV